MPEAATASELNRVLRLPSMALAGASAALELVLELAVQPVSLSAVSVADAPLAGPASGARPRKAVSAAAVSSASRPRSDRPLSDRPRSDRPRSDRPLGGPL